jgi:hypothetical protein
MGNLGRPGYGGTNGSSSFPFFLFPFSSDSLSRWMSLDAQREFGLTATTPATSEPFPTRRSSLFFLSFFLSLPSLLSLLPFPLVLIAYEDFCSLRIAGPTVPIPSQRRPLDSRTMEESSPGFVIRDSLFFSL